MKDEKISVTANKGKENERSIEVTLSAPETLAEAVEAYTEKVVFDIFSAQRNVMAQAFVRGHLAALDAETGMFKKTDDEVLEAFSTWKPTGGNRAKMTPAERLKKHFKGMSKEDVMAALAQLEDDDFSNDEDEGDDE